MKDPRDLCPSPLSEMFEQYREGTRGMPSYDELASLLNAHTPLHIFGAANPEQNAQLARDAQATVDAGVVALAMAADHFNDAVKMVLAAAPQVRANGVENDTPGLQAIFNAAAPQVVADERELPPLPAFDIDGGYYDSESGYSKKTMQDYARAALTAAPVQAQEPVREFNYEKNEAGMTVVRGSADRAPMQPVAVPDGVVEPTYMTEEQGRAWAWKDVKKDVGTEGWTAGENGNYFGFFVHGWNYRGQFEKQRAITPSEKVDSKELSHTEIREILHKHSRYMGQPDYYSDTEFSCLQDVIAFARAIAAKAAS